VQVNSEKKNHERAASNERTDVSLRTHWLSVAHAIDLNADMREQPTFLLFCLGLVDFSLGDKCFELRHFL
jgi:hypothetical protein